MLDNGTASSCSHHCIRFFILLSSKVKTGLYRVPHSPATPSPQLSSQERNLVLRLLFSLIQQCFLFECYICQMCLENLLTWKGTVK